MFVLLLNASLDQKKMSSLIPPLPTGGRPLPTKIVIRLLPPSIEESEILALVPNSVEWHKFVAGKRPEVASPENPIVNSRMYLQFKSFGAASEFISKFHGKIFHDKETHTAFRAVAAFAPFQRIPRPAKQLTNPLDGKIEDQDHFQTFLEDGPAKITDQVAGLLKKDAVAPLVAAIAERNRRLNDQVEQQRAAKAAKKGAAKEKQPKQKAVNPPPKTEKKQKDPASKPKTQPRPTKVLQRPAPTVVPPPPPPPTA